MERNLIFPVQSHYQETDGFEAEQPEPYLEAKLYIERMEQESKRRQKEACKDGSDGPLPPDGPEPLEHGVSVTVYPIRIPSVHLTCATVQWDVPSPSSSVNEINCRDGACLDLVVDPLSSDMPSLSQEDITVLIPEKEHRQTDTVLQQVPNVTAKAQDDSSQMYHTPDMNENVCIMPSNEKDQAPFKDTSRTSVASEDNGSGTFDKNFEKIQSNVSSEDSEIQFCIESSDALEEKNKNIKDTAAEAKQSLGDAGTTNACMELYSEEGRERRGSSENDLCHYEEDIDSKHHSRTAGQNLEEDHSQQTEEPNLMERSNQTHPSSTAASGEKAELPPEFPCGAKQSIEEIDSEMVKPKMDPELSQSEQLETTGNSDKSQQVISVATLDMTSNEMAQLEQLQHEKLQESMQVCRPEEQICGGHVESSLEMEPPEDTQQIEWLTGIEPSHQVAQYNSSDEVEQCEQSKHQEDSLDKKLIEDFKQSGCSEIEPSRQPNESKILSVRESSELSKQSEFSVEKKPLEYSDESDISHEEKLSKQSKQNECSSEEELERQVLQTPLMPESVEPVVLYENGNAQVTDREKARKLAERLYRLENIQRTDVVQHLDKDNDFSRAVGEEYLKFFDFTNQNLDEAIRSFLNEVVLIGESQERERVLECFSNRYQQCNADMYNSAGAVHTLTCALMLLNTDLHGQNVGKAMSFTDFVSNLNGMNEGENFNKDLLKTLYNSIKNHQLEWAVEETYLVKSMSLDPESDQDASLRSKSNPFQDIAHDKKATVFQKGFLKRKAHADIDGKRTPWGKRSWKIFYAVLKGMVLYLQKDEYRKDWQSSEEVLSIHHALAERAQDYTKRPHVFRLQTADWRVFLFEAASTEQMNSWIGRLNLVSALYSSPPFPAAVGSQRRFCRPILPATQSALTLEKQLQSHAASLQSFQEDLNALQQGVPEGRKKAREMEEHRLREEYLQHERCRYETYVQILEVWQTLSKSSETASGTDLTHFDKELWKGIAMEDEEDDEIDGGMMRSHSSPSLELEVAPPPIVKVRRNISERRTYRKIVIPRRNKEL
ncbi:PH and SEC7 domain-containing protein 4 isoform X2 [Electrophorus electricus]|uniref:SEC7 domain-containing protein n=2 Tax=Electrophorus electricus TaxID=8005 RepID=A0A4W4H2G6_ELEEL|nr:PH and SEC7 domain-containing protein 4 isoform X2 [Electrophorus electricus]